MVLEVLMVPKAGLEPARISTVDFESTASTDFATPARKDTENVLDYTCHWLLRKRQSAIATLSVEKNSASRISANIQYVPDINPSFSPFPLAVSSFSESARKILQTAQFGLHFRQFVIRSCY